MMAPSWLDEILGIGAGLGSAADSLSSEIRDSASDIVDSLHYAMGIQQEQGQMGLLDELQRMQLQRQLNRSGAQQTATEVQWRQRQAQLQQQQQAALQNQLGQAQAWPPGSHQQMQQAQTWVSPNTQPALATFAELQAAQQAALAALGMADHHKGVRPEPAKPEKKTVDLVEPGQRKIETDE